MWNELEIDANAIEESLLRVLADTMRDRGFMLLSVVALCEADGAVATLGNVQVTQSSEFARLLRDLADEIEGSADQLRAATLLETAKTRKWQRTPLHLCKKAGNDPH